MTWKGYAGLFAAAAVFGLALTSGSVSGSGYQLVSDDGAAQLYGGACNRTTTTVDNDWCGAQPGSCSVYKTKICVGTSHESTGTKPCSDNCSSGYPTGTKTCGSSG